MCVSEKTKITNSIDSILLLQGGNDVYLYLFSFTSRNTRRINKLISDYLLETTENRLAGDQGRSETSQCTSFYVSLILNHVNTLIYFKQKSRCLKIMFWKSSLSSSMSLL